MFIKTSIISLTPQPPHSSGPRQCPVTFANFNPLPAIHPLKRFLYLVFPITPRNNNPFNATYCASKYAALAVTDAVRIQLKAQGTHVVGVYAGFIDTDMAAQVNTPKTSAHQVAERTLDGLRTGQNHVIADDSARDTRAAVLADPAAVEAKMQIAWEQGAGPWSA